MEENKIPKEGADGAAENASPELVIPKGKFAAWLDNFWYHYKWHSLAALFIVFVVVVCTLQMCSKVSYDVYVVYAGQKEISHTEKNGVVEYMTFNSSLMQVARDVNEDGEINVSLLDLFMLSSEEITEAEKDKDTEVNYALLDNNNTTFKNTVAYSDYYLFFMSSSLYEEYREVAGTKYFENLEVYASLGEHEYYDSGAILLRSTKFGELPGFKDLPEDTVIALRLQGYLESDNSDEFEAAREMLEKILKYE